jgi:hypothetical protein
MADAKSELRELNKIGAFAQKNSGRGKHDKGDGVLDKTWMVDVKEYARSFGISLDVWAKTCTDAFRAGGYEPMLKVVLGTGANKVRLVIHTEQDFLQMKNRIQELESMI